jgi:septum formation protein
MKLILASSSKYRKQLLQRLRLNFECYSPEIDETINKLFSVSKNAKHLAYLKARAVISKHPQATVIASDQICSVDQHIFGKPLEYNKAFEQLKFSSGKKVNFHTAVCVYDSNNSAFHEFTVQTSVYFKNLKDNEIKTYLKLEQPYKCAGSFKAESLGICLFDKIVSEDPTALIGLPLIQLSKVLIKIGINPLGEVSE